MKVARPLNRLPYLASPLLRFNLSDELRQLRNEDSWQRETGRSSKTLAKYPDFRIVLVLMKANTQMKEHHADARISIHSLQGRIRVHLPDQKIELPAGELMALDHGDPPRCRGGGGERFLDHHFLAGRHNGRAPQRELSCTTARGTDADWRWPT